MPGEEGIYQFLYWYLTFFARLFCLQRSDTSEPIVLSESLNKELQTIFLEEYGVEINEYDTQKVAVWLASYFDILAQNNSKLNKS